MAWASPSGRSGAMARRRPPATIWFAVLAAVGLGAGNELTSGGNRSGFVVGLGDHVVLTPYGIHAADPTAFADDWFTREAPQPHWLFDAVVWAGRAAGNLPVALLGYYLLSLAIFGGATALLASRWAGPRGWLAGVASLAVGLLAAYQAIYLAGTNTLNSPLALPNVLGGNLAYLFLAALLTRRRWAPAVLPLVCAAHIQMGLLALVVGALVWCVDAWPAGGRGLRGPARRPLLRAAGWWLAGVATAVFGMRLRAVATDPGAFVEICDRYIGFHCAAGQWRSWQMASTVAAAVLCLCVALLLTGRDRRRYLLAVGLPALGLVAAMVVDRRGIPVLARLVQAYNAYRVGNLVFPFAVWGVLSPFLWSVGRCAAGTRAEPAAGRAGSVLPGVVLALVAPPAAVLFFTSPGAKTPFAEETRLTTMGLWAMCALVVLAGASVVARLGTARTAIGSSPSADRWEVRRHAVAGLAMVLVVVGGLLAVRSAGFTGRTPAPLRWPASAAEGAWGARARAIIGPDVQVLMNPTRANLKLALERGVVVDCKNLPYGGAAYREWNARVDALGGWAQCQSGAPATYDALSGAQLDEAARRYGARAIVIAHRDGAAARQASELAALGYRQHRVEGGVAALDTDIMVR